MLRAYAVSAEGTVEVPNALRSYRWRVVEPGQFCREHASFPELFETITRWHR